MSDQTQQGNDVFAQIASQRISYRAKTLIEPGPPSLPEKYLPSGPHDPAAAFKPVDRIDTAEKLQTQLAVYKSRYLKFMQNLAPQMPQFRTSIQLSTFDWRIEKSEDRSDFLSVLAGKGEWQNVTIPHFGEPLGLAVTYYRTEFEVTPDQIARGAAFIHFNGVDYKAHVFVNNSFVGSHEGFFAPFEFDITPVIKQGRNTLLVKVENDYICAGNNAWGSENAGDKIYASTGPGYDDPQLGWHHCPPGMGIYQDVSVEFRPRVFINDIFVRPLPAQNRAQAWIEVFSCDPGRNKIEISLSVYGQNFQHTVLENLSYSPQALNEFGLNDEFGIALAKANGTFDKPVQLYIERGINYFKIPFEMPGFRRWTLEEPWLYQLQVKLHDQAGSLIDSSKRHFGMRSFTMDQDSTPKGMLFFNDQPIRLRGTNTMGHEQQCVMKKDYDQLIDDILLAKICNMNFLRITQRPVQDEIYNYCDMLGLMTQSDLPVFGVLRRTQYVEALRQTAEMEKLIRSHPCNIMVSYVNEPLPNAGNKPHRHLTRDELEDFFKAADDLIHHLNPDRLIKPIDGDYDPPSPGLPDRHCYPCWYNGHGVDIGKLHRGFWQLTKSDWYYACGEFGAEGLECAETMRKFYPPSWLPSDAASEPAWSPLSIAKAQTGNFHHFFFDTQDTLADWITASQQHQAWSAKIMTEAFRRDNRMVSFAIHLFIDAFPAGWMKSIMDCRRLPKKACFAYRDALAPLLPTLRSDRYKFFSGETARIEAWISNDLCQAPQGTRLHYQLESKETVLWARSCDARISNCSSDFQGYITFECPSVPQRTAYTLRIAIADADGTIINDNSLELEIFPQIIVPADSSVCVLGTANGPAAQLASELGLRLDSLNTSRTILIDDFNAYKANESAVNQAVSAGALAIFLELKPGTYDIASNAVTVKASSFNPLHFASRKTSHPLVSGFCCDDFKHWYSPAADRIKAIVETTFTGENWQPVLTAGNADHQGRWVKQLAVGQKKYDKGSFFISQLQLAGRTSANPAARLFALRLLGIQN